MYIVLWRYVWCIEYNAVGICSILCIMHCTVLLVRCDVTLGRNPFRYHVKFYFESLKINVMFPTNVKRSDRKFPLYGRYVWSAHSAECGPGMVANPARGQLNRGQYVSLSPFASENLVSRDVFGCPVPRQPDHSPHSG